MSYNSIFVNSDKYNVPNIVSTITFLNSIQKTNICLDFITKTVDTPIDIDVIKSTDAFDSLIKIPFGFDRIVIELSALSNTNLRYVLYTDFSTKTYQMTSKKAKLPLDHEDVGTIKLTVWENTKQLFVFKFVRDKTKTYGKDRDPHKSECSTVFKTGILSNPFPIPMADGPLFREAISTYEQLTPIILKRIHSSLEKKLNSETALKGSDFSKTQMLDAFKDLKKGILVNFRGDNVYANYDNDPNSSKSDLVYKFLAALRTRTAQPSIELKTFKELQNFSSKKKAFEDDSKKYYEWLSKLMSSGKSKDEKLLFKMKNFEVSQMQYFNYLFDAITPLLIKFLDLCGKASEDYLRNKSRREYAVEEIKKCLSFDAFIDKMKNYLKLEPQKSNLLLMDPKSPYKIESFKNSMMKSGLLFVHGGQGKSGWHKQWLVLYDGKLYEYMDWRKGAALRNSPIDVSLCNIKLLDSNEQKNTIDIGARKNCFRVINSQGVEHVFQTFTPKEAADWVKALSEASQIVSYSKKRDSNYDYKQNTTSIEPHNRSTGSLTKVATRSRRVSSVSLSLLNLVRRNSPSNAICADCGSNEHVEWISLNLLVTFCIQCSSAHRNLGSSVSKVRSLTLDSFAAETRSLLYHIDNQRSNSIYEALPTTAKPKPNSSDKERLDYIRNKYALRKYVSKDVTMAGDKILLDGLRSKNIGKILAAIAAKANLNRTIEITEANTDELKIMTPGKLEITPLEYALLNPSVIDGSEIFEIAELLVLNGCDAGTQVREGSLVDDKARKWWQEKINKFHYGEASNNIDNTVVKDLRKSISCDRPNISALQSSKVKSRSPKESFNLLKKKLKHHT